ncbi:lipoprotein [Erwinia pyrifoliae]|uniref:Lipoprotein n=1 Tax=Erwinia pyrifoliae TaxID=79967 RepID=A0ABY5X564_ERWPY|nr:lipoprotein [Erwinia pyrifoliae]AUX72251.1 lipoprotein [Erwinia pyrifoliae]MCA8877508.1 lipoprotein [Erwinia pyrifoliae]MCT2388502.1 lipoprotein [Erwinia pyrifoliae]MCU8586671.1 lipoprotein [Erwinia pyrifoliae]UWS30556.1 lipoprotein [Erwinia pyrifoliae]
MKYPPFAAVIPVALLLSACSTVEPAWKDTGTRLGSCVDGGPDSVAQQFYDLRAQQPSNGVPDAQLLAKYRPYLSDKLYQSLIDVQRQTQKSAILSGDIFSSASEGASHASVADASTIPNRDARNIPLRVTLAQGNREWQDEVLMVREGACWTVDDVRYLGHNPHLGSGSLYQLLSK